MILEQKTNLIFSLLGVVSGFVSVYLRDISLSFTIPPIIYFVAYLIALKIIKTEKKKWVFSNSSMSFLLTWLIVWILLFNLM